MMLRAGLGTLITLATISVLPTGVIADSLMMTLGDAVSNRSSGIESTLNAAPAGGATTRVKTPVTNSATFFSHIASLRDGDILYLNAHSNPDLVSLGTTDLTFDDIAAALRVDEEGNPRTPPRLLAVIVDGCMIEATRDDFEHISQAFNAELVIGWASAAQSLAHQSCMWAILHHVFVDGAPLAELPYDKVPAMCGRPYLYAYPNVYGWTVNEVQAHLRERLGRGAQPDLGADVYNDAYCAQFFAANPAFCQMPAMNAAQPDPEVEAARSRCCHPLLPPMPH